LGAAASFHSGSPEIGALTSSTMRQGLDTFAGGPAWIPVDRDRADRLPPYFRLDARVARAFDLKPIALEAYLDLFNLTLNPETMRYQYRVDQAGGEPKLLRVADRTLLALPVLGLKASY